MAVTLDAMLRSFVHNCVAHPLVFVGNLGDWLHDLTAAPSEPDPAYDPENPF